MIKALSCKEPGRFEYVEVGTPEALKGHSTLRIKRVGICGTDLHAYKGSQPYFNYPRVLGHEIAAEYFNGDHPDLKKGDLCTLMPYLSCGHCTACKKGKTNCCQQLKVCGVHIDGAMCEYFSISNDLIIPADGLGLDELALMEPLSVAAHGIFRAGDIQREQVLIMGAGPIGLGLVILAQLGEAEIWLMDVNQDRLAFASRSYNVKHTIEVDELKADQKFSTVIDATGNLQAIESGLNYVDHGGQYILVGLQKQSFSFSHPEFHKRETTLKSSRNATLDDFNRVKKAIQSKAINVLPLITHRMKFDQVIDRFETLYDPGNKVIKALIEL